MTARKLAMKAMEADVAIVGAGAAGILAAWRAASLGAKVVVLEKTLRIGTKILISGGGKCNITQAGDLEDVLRGFRPNEARFLRPAFYRCPNTQIVQMLESRGLRVYTRPDGRIFPVDQTAKDVVAVLRRMLDEAGVEVRLGSPVNSILVDRGDAVGVRFGSARAQSKAIEEPERGYRPRTAKNLLGELERVEAVGGEEGELRAGQIIVCAGGSSYPNSGTTGDAWRWARDLGHRVERLRAALAPIYVDGLGDLAGVSMRDVVLKARQNKEAARWRGDLLFTHQGISGPAALGISRIVAERMEFGEVTLEIDVRPDTTPEGVSGELQDYVTAHPTRRVSGFLYNLPDRVAEALLASVEIPPDRTNSRLDRKSRNRLAETLKGWRLGKVRHVPLERGEVVAGGVALDEVDPQTMRSRLVEGLLFCGEVLDIAGPVGGYNLQAAFSTGYVAGESAASAIDRNRLI